MLTGDGVALSVAVMAHPTRADEALAFIAAHPELEATIIVDPRPGPGGSLRTAAAAMACVAPDATHHLVLQDDVVLARGYVQRLLGTVASHPRASVSLFAEWGSRTSWMIRLAAATDRWVAAVVDPYVPTQGVVVPHDVARSFAEYARGASGPDDQVLADHLAALAVPSVVTVPALLEHDDRPSLTGNGFQGERRSACFMPDVSALPLGPYASVAGQGLERVPQMSWMRGVSEWFATRRPASQAFVGTPLLADVGHREIAALHAAFREHISAVDAADRAAHGVGLRDIVDDVVLVELWLAAYFTGRASNSSAADVLTALTRPVGIAAARSALPGALRRFLALPARVALADAGGQLVAAAAGLGAAHVHGERGPDPLA